MRSWMIAMLAAVAVFAVGVNLPVAGADEPAGQAVQAEQAPVFQCPMHPGMRATWQTKCPKCGMTMTKAEKPAGMGMMAGKEKAGDKPMTGKKEEGGAQPMAGMMGMMGDMQGMMMRCRMMMGAKMDKTDPASVLALKDELNLTDTQARAIEQIGLTARRQTEAILNDEQTRKLDAMGGKPECMTEMHARMEKMMKGMKEKMKEGAATEK